LDGSGNVYGTTFGGGNETGQCGTGGCGTAFELKPPTKMGGAWTEKVLRRFEFSEANPAAGMTFDGRGYLYGTNAGTIFRLIPPSTKSRLWKETILYTFGQDAYDPKGALTFDRSGNLYGTTEYGNGGELYGSVFRLKPPQKSGGAWLIDYLYGFVYAPNGLYPAAGLVFDKAGNLYSTTTGGGRGTCSRYCGTVFEVLAVGLSQLTKSAISLKSP
jgi:hypothetical protein